MNEPIYKYLKIGTIHFMSFPEVIGGEGPIEETLKTILEDDYFNAVEITWIKDSEVRKKSKKYAKICPCHSCIWRSAEAFENWS